MITEEQVRKSLEELLVHGAMRSAVGLNLVRKVMVSDQEIKIALA